MKASQGERLSQLIFDDIGVAKNLFGEYNINLKLIEKALGINIHIRGTQISIQGPDLGVSQAEKLLTELYELIRNGNSLSGSEIKQALRISNTDPQVNLKELFSDTIYLSSKQRKVTPKSLMQSKYVEAIRKFDVVFAIGPAGTGKTYLAMAMAMNLLMKKEVNRLVLARPAVEAGEKLGYLPGDLFEKVNPYLRPLYDALHDMVDYEQASKLVERGTIEVAPLGFMRGRTLNNCFVILDEAQNTTSEQMMMFLTRLGFDSKAVITGDITQVDLPADKSSGLIEARGILQGIPGIEFIHFSEKDVVRHPLVQEIIKAYEKAKKC
ncbi:MAG: PhoH family protein [Deltaproteobacteria bacterium]|nr:MAG: PhoH family protein [Deltaproteobacteria bacterium]